jgi:glycosyltransferase domain-containing protein
VNWDPADRATFAKLSIVMFTYERHQYALRNMRLWSNSAVKLYVLDGSAQAIDASFLRSIGNNIIYLHKPIPLLDRFASIVEVIKTEFVAFMADDDFFIPSAMKSCILQLEKYPDLVSCSGRSLEKVLSSDLVVHQSAIRACQSIKSNSELGAVDLEDPIERMVSHMNPYCPSTFYGVCRSWAWKPTVQLMSTQHYSSGLVAEHIFELSMSFYGKIKVIEELMWLRSNENGSNIEGFELAFDDWYVGKDFALEVLLFSEATTSALSRMRADLSNEEISFGLERACRAYVVYCKKIRGASVNKSSSSGLPMRQLTTIKYVLKYAKFLLTKFPNWMVDQLPIRLRFQSYSTLAKAMQSSGVRVDWIQFNAILDVVESFHKVVKKT